MTAEASKVSFDASLAKAPQLENVPSKRHRMKFLRRKAKAQDEDENEDEAEIKKLQRRVEYLERKKKLVQKIKKIERGIEAVDAESDDDTSSEKQASPKRWPSFSLRRRKNRDRNDSFEDDLSSSDDDDNSPLLEKVNSALDYIEDACSPIISDLKVVCTDLLSSLDKDHLHCPKFLNDVDASSNRAKAAHEDSIIEQDVKSESHEVPKDSQLPSLAPIINMLTTQTSLSFSRTENAADNLLEQKKSSSHEVQSYWKSAPTNVKPVAEIDSSPGHENNKKDSAQIPKHNEHEASTNKTANISRGTAECLFLSKETGQPANSMDKPAIASVDEMDIKLVKVTVTAMAFSGLSIISKTSNKYDVPPVRAVLSVLKDKSSDEGSVFTHVSSRHVVQDTSRRPVKKSKLDRSSKYYVIGLWDVSKVDDFTIPGEAKSSVTFSRCIGMSPFEKLDKKPEVTLNPSNLHLRICIKRDDSDDILPVGVANVSISGWEPREVELSLPVRPEYYKSIADLTKKLDNKPPQSKWESFKTFVLEDEDDVMSSVRFLGFKNEAYRLEKDSFIRIRLKIAPTDQEQQSRISASLNTSKVTATKSESHGLHWTSKPTERQEEKSITLSEVHRVVEATRVISDVEKPSISATVIVENNQHIGEDSSCVEESFRKALTQVGEGTYNPSNNSQHAYPTLNTTDNKENIANSFVIPLKPFDEGAAEKVVSQKSKKVWFQRTKTTKIRDADVSSGSHPMLDKKFDIKTNADGAVACGDAGAKESQELETDHTPHEMSSCSGVVDAEPSLVEIASPENTNNVSPLDSTDKSDLLQLEKECISALQADQVTRFDGSEDAQPQAFVSDKSSSKKPVRDKSQKNSKSWFKKTSKASKMEQSPSLFSGSFKEADASDPFFEASQISSDDVQTLVTQEMVSDNCNIHKETSDPLAKNFLENINEDNRRSLVTTSLKSKKSRSSHSIPSEFTEDGRQVVNDRKDLYPIMSSNVDSLSFPAAAAAAETSLSMNENSMSLKPNVDFNERVHAKTVKIGELDILQGSKCIERNSLQFVSEHEVEVTPEDFLKAAELTKVLTAEEFAPAVRSNSSFSNRDICLIANHADGEQINGSVGSFKDIVNDSYDLSECHCEDCKSKSLTSLSKGREELCESIELELKKKASKSALGFAKDRHAKQKKTLTSYKSRYL
ncbi:hypothetical protein ACHAW6_007788 [Cyclotella cf. meneghiniana]